MREADPNDSCSNVRRETTGRSVSFIAQARGERRLAAATGRSRLNTLAGPNLHCRFVVCSRSSHSLLDLACHG